ncbi:hypothetical protein SAMN05519103_09662 [Rhizobiales bacterium GAS113]|nr:hypothetical protein SAMN05519103_09662 [Rhizobiales bacterium GAS113]SEF05915.1 hypothetical protein SAMN05519104_8125 [Rhizobiales bacterium GAS188]
MVGGWHNRRMIQVASIILTLLVLALLLWLAGSPSVTDD